LDVITFELIDIFGVM